MKVYSGFNRLYHSVLADFWKQATAARLNIQSFADFKENFKSLNSEYPTKDGKPVSTKDLDNKQMLNHLTFIIDFASYYGFELKFVKDEWERLMRSVGARNENNI